MTVELATVADPVQEGPGRVDVAAEWAAVAEVADVARSTGTTAGAEPVEQVAGHEPANLSVAVRSFAARRDLRRILIAFGAIGKPRPDGESGTPARPEDVVGAFITASPEILQTLLESAGAVQDPDRIARFITGMAEAGQRCDPSDGSAVEAWIGEVATILRDQA